MAYQTSHPVEVGAFGYFKHGGKKLVDTWVALEDLCHDTIWFIGIYSKQNVLEWAKQAGLLSKDEIDMIEAAF